MKKSILAVILTAAALLAGCNLAVGLQSTPTLNPLDPTSISGTVYAQLTLNAPPTATLVPATATSAASPTPQASPTPSLTPTITLTPTPSVPVISASINTNCRSGPGIVYPVVGYLLVGDSREVVARLADNSWWVIQHPTRAGQVCWVWAQTTLVSGNTALLPAATPPPTPTPTSTPTSTQTATATRTVALTPVPGS